MDMDMNNLGIEEGKQEDEQEDSYNAKEEMFFNEEIRKDIGYKKQEVTPVVKKEITNSTVSSATVNPS